MYCENNKYRLGNSGFVNFARKTTKNDWKAPKIYRRSENLAERKPLEAATRPYVFPQLFRLQLLGFRRSYSADYEVSETETAVRQGRCRSSGGGCARDCR